MYKRLALLALSFSVLSIYSCKPKEEKKTDDEAPIPAGMVRLNLSSAGINATIDVPDTAADASGTKVVHGVVASSSGSVNVYVGKAFNILINVSGEPMSVKKADVNGDDLNKPKTWVVNDSNFVLYSTQKDTNAFANAKEEFHFYAIVKKGTSTFYVQELEQGADGNVNVFNQAAAQTMLNSAKSLTPVVKAPAKTDNPS